MTSTLPVNRMCITRVKTHCTRQMKMPATVINTYKQLLDEVFVISRIIKVEVWVISRSRRLRLITLQRPWLFWISQKPNLIIVLLYIERNKKKIVCASSLTARKTKRANLTWLPWEIMHRGHTRYDYPWPWHDYPWPWHDYWIICSYDVKGADFEN